MEKLIEGYSDDNKKTKTKQWGLNTIETNI